MSLGENVIYVAILKLNNLKMVIFLVEGYTLRMSLLNMRGGGIVTNIMIGGLNSREKMM